MPGNFRSAIFIFQNRLTAYRFRIKKKQAILQDQQEYSFVQQNLPQVFSKLKKSFHTNKFYLLLPETHTYLKLLEFSASTKLDRSLVLQKAQETIPEQIQEGYYDWKQRRSQSTHAQPGRSGDWSNPAHYLSKRAGPAFAR